VYNFRTRGKRVLIVEDYDDSAQALRVCLQRHGHAVEVASTGSEAMELASSFTPEVIVCDLVLPDMGGLEVARRIRCDPQLKDVRLIALTAYSVPWHAQAAGFDAYVNKPADLEAIALLLHDEEPPVR
jgi:CheY-like chemotaxis protein